MDDNNKPHEHEHGHEHQHQHEHEHQIAAEPVSTGYQPVAPAYPEYAPSGAHSQQAQFVTKPQSVWLKTTAYLPEYAVMLLLLSVAVGAATTLLGIGIDSLIKTESVEAGSALGSYGDSLNAFRLVSSLSALIAALPIFAWLFVRTRNTEAALPEIKQHRWRKAFLGIFLAFEGLSVVWSIGDLAYDLLGRAIGDGGGVLSYFAGSSPDPWWQVVLTSAITIGALVFTVFAMSRDYRAKKVA